MSDYNFVRFEAQARIIRQALPQNMFVGQIVRRKCKPSTVKQLKCMMRKAMREKGWTYSIHESERLFVIRRDT